MLHDGAEDHRLELLPFAVALGDGDEIRTKEDAADARNVEQALGERRLRRLLGPAQIEGAVFQHRASGQELQCRRIRRRFGLDKHFSSSVTSRRLYWRRRNSL